MSFLKRIFGTKQTWVEFSRQQLRVRVHTSSQAQSSDLSTEDIDALSDEEIMCMPDATIVMMAKTYGELKIQGADDASIFELIENYRNLFQIGGEMPEQPSLFEYTKYRVRLEHGHGLQMTDAELYFYLRQACEFFDVKFTESKH